VLLYLQIFVAFNWRKDYSSRKTSTLGRYIRSDSNRKRKDYSSKAKDRPTIASVRSRRDKLLLRTRAHVSLSSRRRRKRRETVSSCRPYIGNEGCNQQAVQTKKYYNGRNVMYIEYCIE
jgi:hypothetical protein